MQKVRGSSPRRSTTPLSWRPLASLAYDERVMARTTVRSRSWESLLGLIWVAGA